MFKSNIKNITAWYKNNTINSVVLINSTTSNTAINKTVDISRNLAAICVVLAAFLLPLKTQPTLATMLLGCILAIFGFLIFKENQYNRILLLKSPIAMIAIALFVVILFSYPYSTAPIEARIKYILSYRELLFTSLMMLIFYHCKKYQYWSMNIFMGISFIIVIISIINSIYPIAFTNSFNDGVAKQDSYIFHSHIVQNVFSAMLALFILICIKHQKLFSIYWILLVFALLATIFDILFLVRGRTGQLTLISSISIFILISSSFRFKLLSTFVLGLVAVILLNTNNRFNDSIHRTHTEISDYQATGKDTSAGIRIEFWKYTFAEITKKPLSGYGAGMYWKNYANTLLKENPNKIGYMAGLHHPHNEFLFLWHDVGLIAFLLYVALIIALAWQAFYTNNKDYKIMRFGIVSSLLIYSLIDVPFFNSAEGMFYALMIAIFFSINAPIKKQPLTI